jgi:hypothetical protein
MLSSGMRRRMDVLITDVSEELIATNIMVERISELGIRLAVTLHGLDFITVNEVRSLLIV